MANKFFKKPKNLAVQLKSLQLKYNYIECELKKGKLVWKQLVSPSKLSKKYEITVVYDGIVPKVYLYNQGIMKKKNDDIPHCYEWHYNNSNDEYVRICLYYPQNSEWSKDMLLSETIIPWAIEWLYYYEIWRINGKWLGGGVEHAKNKKNLLHS